MPRVQLDVIGLEFEDGGNTIWVHGRQGTVLRIKCSGKIIVHACANDYAAPHSDVQVDGDINVCIPNGELAESGRQEIWHRHED